jgi:GT2 family glycosyltransferase/glycosyltransferase involved in cell wall biosynthesis
MNVSDPRLQTGREPQPDCAPHAVLAPLADPVLDPLFWRPARLNVESAWFGHVPFAHWIVAAQRPASIVELGAHNGVSYAAFCEAVVRARLDTRAIAVDTWQGDEHAGFYGQEVYADLLAFHDQRYAAFSTLLHATFDEALQFVADGSVDLLHIDGRHRYEDVAHDFATWRPKLSPRAVVLFHDTNVRERDFGVWRLWAELAAGFPHFEFLHAHGLGVLAVGAACDGPVAALCALAEGREINAIRERFSVLGERWVAARDLAGQQSAAAGLSRELERITADLAATRAWADTAQAEVNRLFPQYQHLQEAHRAARASLSQARFELAARRLQEEPPARPPETDPALARITDLDAARAAILRLQRAYTAMHSSTSWRITAPLRRLIARLRGEPAPADPGLILLPEEELAEKPKETGPRALFISGEDHTPGTIYRVERMAATARSLGFEARTMPAGPVGPADLAGVRLVVLWRVPYSAHVQGIITLAREQGATVLFDVDDLMFRPELATIEVIDGIRSQRFSEVQTQEFFASIARTLRACDLVTCPTAELAHHVHLMGRPAAVLPNGFDQESHDAARSARRDWLEEADDLVRIGYASGSRTHQRDFAVAAPAIARVLRAHPQTRLTLFRDPSSLEGLVLIDEFPEFADLADRIEWRNLVSLPDLPAELARFAINIAPLQADNPFCEAKSELKFFEAGLAGVPTVASPTGPFRRAITHGVSGLLAATEEEWHSALVGLVQDPVGRARIAQSAYHVALARFGPQARQDAFSIMLAQIEGGAAGAAAFERAAYRAALPPAPPPHVPECDVLFARDQRGHAAVTVIVPVFNYADLVLEALMSVAAQTIEAVDLVVIDDASPDDSAALVLDWAQANQLRFNRITLLRHAENAGLGFARNSGFAAAETDFVLPLDADNRLRPQACASLLAALVGSGAAFAYPAIRQFGDGHEVFGTEPYSVLRLQPGNYIDAMALVRKSAWAAAGGYDHVPYGWEDFDFWCRIAERGGHGVAVGEVLADYRVHEHSMLHTVTERRDNRDSLVADLMRRHPWLDLPR